MINSYGLLGTHNNTREVFEYAQDIGHEPGILEMHRERLSLEEVFRALTRESEEVTQAHT